MEWPNCVRCHSKRVVPGGISEPHGAASFFVDVSIARRPAFLAANHTVPLEVIAWLCLDCGLAWQEANAESLRDFQPVLREKCLPEFRKQLFGD